MITLHTAIRALNSSIVTIRGDVAYDQEGAVIAYNKSAAETKLAELQIAETTAQAAEAAAKTSALSKLSALGLTDAEIKALTGTT
jgi:hypothetical protein